jgi:hypothetical protein
VSRTGSSQRHSAGRVGRQARPTTQAGPSASGQGVRPAARYECRLRQDLCSCVGPLDVDISAKTIAKLEPACITRDNGQLCRCPVLSTSPASRQSGPGSAQNPRVCRQRVTMLLMIDNYDSFTYNLVQYFGELGQEVRVFRNDAISLHEIARLQPASWSFLRARVRRRRPASRWRRFASLPAGFHCSAYASVIRRSVRPSAAASCTRRS